MCQALLTPLAHNTTAHTSSMYNDWTSSTALISISLLNISYTDDNMMATHLMLLYSC